MQDIARDRRSRITGTPGPRPLLTRAEAAALCNESLWRRLPVAVWTVWDFISPGRVRLGNPLLSLSVAAGYCPGLTQGPGPVTVTSLQVAGPAAQYAVTVT
jgi:hypothetical protein